MDQPKSMPSNSAREDDTTKKLDSVSESRSCKGDNPSKGTIAGSPKVHFSSGTKKGDGHTRGVKRTGTRAFRDIVWQEVIGTDKEARRSTSGAMTSPASSAASSSSKRGILKLCGEAALGHRTKTSEKESLCFVNQAYIGNDDVTMTEADLMTTSTTVPHLPTVSSTEGSAFPFDHRRCSENVFASVVDLLFQRSSLDLGKRDMHPFGRDCSVEAIIRGSSIPKAQNMSSGFSKLVLWVTLLSFLLGAAVGVIFLSETYNAKHRQDELLKAATNDSQNMTS